VRTNRETERAGPEQDRPVRPNPPAPTPAEQILAMQRSAGNAAVARALADRPVTPADRRHRIEIAPGRRPPPGLPAAAKPAAGPYGEMPKVEGPYGEMPKVAGPYGEMPRLVEVDVSDVEEEDGELVVAEEDLRDASDDEGATSDEEGETTVAFDWGFFRRADRGAESGPAAEEKEEAKDPYAEEDEGFDAYAARDMTPEELDGALDREGAVGEILATNKLPPDVAAKLREQRNKVPPRKYGHLKSRSSDYATEHESSGDWIRDNVFPKVLEYFKAGMLPGDALREHFGWTDEDIDRYWTNRATNLKDAKVEKHEGAERDDFQLFPGSTFTQGADDKIFDTSGMNSKFMGSGFGIYIMDEDGHFYADAHRVGLFHHSSLAGGLQVAGAGELKVTHGALEHITNKSGHYLPGKAEMIQVLEELERQGVSLSGVGLNIIDGKMSTDDKGKGGAVPEGAQKWLEDNRELGA
jgi:hypothetical protein